MPKLKRTKGPEPNLLDRGTLMARLKDLARKRKWSIGGIVAFGGTMLAFIDSASVNRFVWWIFETVTEIIALLWTRAAIIFSLLMFSAFATLFLFRRNSQETRRNMLSGVFRWLALFVLQLAITISLTQLMYFDMLPSRESADLFPQLSAFGPTAVRTYASNGAVVYRYDPSKEIGGPEKGYARLLFRTFGGTNDYNCGWVLVPLRGIDLGGFKALRFLVRGEFGGEQLGVKAKDARGVEGLVLLDVPPNGASAYMSGMRITIQWQEAVIPLDHFGQVDFGLLENISLFTTGAMAGVREQTVFVGGFRLIQ